MHYETHYITFTFLRLSFTFKMSQVHICKSLHKHLRWLIVQRAAVAACLQVHTF